MKYQEIQKRLKTLGDTKRATGAERFFKTGPGQYGEGDVFIGISVPQLRKITREYEGLVSFDDLKKLLSSRIHEERFVALVVLVSWMKSAHAQSNLPKQKEIFDFYMGNVRGVNNWDLVDVSAPSIVGIYLSSLSTQKRLVYSKACIVSGNLWVNRIIIVACLYEIKQGDENMIFLVAEKSFSHSHDLIHKALGWMLREVGKSCGQQVLEGFIQKHIHRLPRTTLRYAIERFPESTRKKYLRIQ